MKIRILFFAALAEAVGQPEIDIDVQSDCSVAELLGLLASEHPEIDAIRNRLAVAVNCEYVAMDHRLADGDEVALISPVSGG